MCLIDRKGWCDMALLLISMVWNWVEAGVMMDARQVLAVRVRLLGLAIRLHHPGLASGVWFVE